MKRWNVFAAVLVCTCFFACKKSGDSGTTAPPVIVPQALTLKATLLNNASIDNSSTVYGVPQLPVIKLQFSVAVLESSVAAAISLTDTKTGTAVPVTTIFQNNDSSLLVQPAARLNGLAKYDFELTKDLVSVDKLHLTATVSKILITQIDSSRKFAVIADNDLLDTIQKRTFKYFWDFGHPVSGRARERNTSGETVTSGGSGFGIMAIVTGVSRNFITRSQGLARMQNHYCFLKKYGPEISWRFSALVKWNQRRCNSF